MTDPLYMFVRSQQVLCYIELVIWPRYIYRRSYDLNTKSDVSCSIDCY